MSNTDLEQIKIGFFGIDKLNWLININTLGFVLLTIAVLFFISEKFYIRIIKAFYKNIEQIETSVVYIIYNFIRRAFLYISLAFISVILIYRGVWFVELDKNIEIFSIWMLIGFAILLISIVITSTKLIEKSIRKYVFLGMLILGYLVYGFGFFVGVNIIK